MAAAGLALSGCSAFNRWAGRQTDKDVYRVVAAKEKAALGESTGFSLAPPANDAAESLSESAHPYSLADEAYTTPSLQIGLADALAIAFSRNREYLARKEDLYLRALALVETRWESGTIFNAGGAAEYNRVESGHESGIVTVERFGSYDAALGATRKIIATGARITADYTHSFLRYFSEPQSAAAANSLAVSIVQPLLNGAGSLVAGETLRQAERDLIYEVRDFARFRQDFAIRAAERFYNLLQTQDRLKNEQLNYDNALADEERAAARAQAGRIPEFEADQARQRTLSARNEMTNARAAYLIELDEFRFFLGLPPNLDFGPDPRELDRIAERGLLRPDMDLDAAIAAALENRLDLQTRGDRIADSLRKAKIASRNFLPVLDASYAYSTTKTGPDDQAKLDFKNSAQKGALDFSLPLDWIPRRNKRRAAEIAADRARRDMQEGRDKVVIEVHNNREQLERLRKNYEIQLTSVALAERRVESASLFLAAGRAATRDLLEAQSALLEARNAATEALVSHTIRRLRFWNAIERLRVDAKGAWDEEDMRSHSNFRRAP